MKNQVLKSSFKTIVVIICFLVSNSLHATTYYVSNSGNDSNNGTSSSTPWASIAKVNSVSLKPGDKVLFKSGDTWRAYALSITQSGTKDSYIEIGSYDLGNKPRIIGSLKESNWQRYEAMENVWISSGSYNSVSGEYAEIFLVASGESGNDTITWGNKKVSTNVADLTSNYAWLLKSKKVYVYYDGDINADFEYVEVPQIKSCIKLNNNYISIDNLEVGFSTLSGIRDVYPMINQEGLSITNCHIHHIGHKGSETAYGVYLCHSDAYYGYNEMNDCGRRSLSLSLLEYNETTIGSGHMENVIIENNHFHHGWHTTGLDMISATNDIIDSVIIRNNFFEGSPEVDLTNDLNTENSNHIFISNKAGGKLGDKSYSGNIYIYNNIFSYAHGKSIAFEYIEDTYIVNNTFYGVNTTIPNYQAAISLGYSCKNIDIRNNIIYNNDPKQAGKGFYNYSINSDAYNNKVTIDYNLYEATSSNINLLYFRKSSSGGSSVSPSVYKMNQWATYRTNHPTYDANSPKPTSIHFINPKENNFALQNNSPALGAAQKISWITHDYYGKEMNNPPDLGAIQYEIVSANNMKFNKFRYQGKCLGIKTSATGTNSSNTPLLAVGNTKYNGNNPPKFLNAEFNWIKIKVGENNWVNVKNGETIKIQKNTIIKAEASVGNLQEATWLSQANCKGKSGAVYLSSTNVSELDFEHAIDKNTTRFADNDFGGEFILTNGISKETRIVLQMTAKNRAWFGEKIEFVLAPANN